MPEVIELMPHLIYFRDTVEGIGWNSKAKSRKGMAFK